MEHIALVKNWYSYQTLSGIKLEDGEVLKIKFPNNKVIEAKIFIVKSKSFSAGAYDTATEEEAFINVLLHGIPAVISLKDNHNKLLCERVNKPEPLPIKKKVVSKKKVK